jgi:F-type H+-transporting ATPase subunit gamma
MALQAKVIKQKIKGVGNIRKITRTMEMVSVSKMKKAVASAFLLREYASKTLALAEHLIDKLETSHPLIQENITSSKKLIIIIGSNKGLCGSYNTNIYRELVKNFRNQNNIDVITVGKQAEKIAKRMSMPVVASFVEWGDSPIFEDTKVLSDIVINLYQKGEYQTVQIVYTEYIKAMSYKTVLRQVLPFVNKNLENILHEEHENQEIFIDTVIEPSHEVVLETIAPRVLQTLIHSAVLESLASEHSSRMFAMNTATENAKEMLRVLNISYNRARQDAVTQELAEIAAGVVGVV